MPTVRMISAIASLVILCACAGSKTTVKPDAATSSSIQKTGCLRETGSRISTAGAACSGFGHSYSGDDIDRTGSSTVGGSLRLLDPSLTVH
jgi:hypothetical protein